MVVLASPVGRDLLLRTPFTPKSIPNLEFWYEADRLALSDGAAVATWPDLSGLGRDLSQGTGSKQPLFRATGIGGLPAVEADDVDDFLQSANFTFNQPEHVFLVIRWGSFTVNDYVLDGNALDTMDWLCSAAATMKQYAGAFGGAVALAAATNYVQSLLYNNASSSVKVNNGAAVTGTVGTANAGGLTVFANGNRAGAGSSNVRIAFLCGYSRQLSASEELRLVTALGKKYGITVS